MNSKKRFRIRWADLLSMLAFSGLFAWFIVYCLMEMSA